MTITELALVSIDISGRYLAKSYEMGCSAGHLRRQLSGEAESSMRTSFLTFPGVFADLWRLITRCCHEPGTESVTVM
jgi:hypothetical protein